MELQLEVRDGPGDVPRARHAVAAALHDAGVRTDHDAVALVLTELLTNAVLHGSGPITVHTSTRGDCVRVEVTDGAVADVPHRVEAGPTRETGRGLHLVSVIADRWGVHPGAGGKTVWAEIDAGQPGEPSIDLSRREPSGVDGWSTDGSSASSAAHGTGSRPPVDSSPDGQLATTSQ